MTAATVRTVAQYAAACLLLLVAVALVAVCGGVEGGAW